MRDEPAGPRGVAAEGVQGASAGRGGSAVQDERENAMSPRATPPRYLTADIPGTGGVIKQRPEDFLVDEIPLYEPSGEGEHIYLLIQKHGMSTMDMVGEIARHFGVERRAIGTAGLKDKHAITRQVISIHAPGKRPEDFPMLRHERISVLWADLHGNKLRAGHLKGNRFSIRIRGVNPMDVTRAQKALRRLETEGVPNRIGEQRFGMLMNNHLIGRALVLDQWDEALQQLLGPSAQFPERNAAGRKLFAEGKYAEALDAFPRSARAERQALGQLARGRDARRAVLSIDNTLLGFFVSALQSAVFNRVLDRRIETGDWNRIVEGDLALKHDNYAVFAVDAATFADPETHARCARFEISPSGAMWGAGMPRPAGAIGQIEREALAEFGLSPEQIDAFSKRAGGMIRGERRPLRVRLTAPDIEGGVDEHGAYIRAAFELPRGSFATVVLAEIMKPADTTPPGRGRPNEDSDSEEESD